MQSARGSANSTHRPNTARTFDVELIAITGEEFGANSRDGWNGESIRDQDHNAEDSEAEMGQHAGGCEVAAPGEPRR